MDNNKNDIVYTKKVLNAFTATSEENATYVTIPLTFYNGLVEQMRDDNSQILKYKELVKRQKNDLATKDKEFEDVNTRCSSISTENKTIKSKINEQEEVIAELSQKNSEMIRINNNLSRIVKERTNIDTKQIPKKTYIGYKIKMQKDVTKYYYDQYKKKIQIKCYYSSFRTPYLATIPMQEAKSLIIYDFEHYLIDNNPIYKYFGFDYCYIDCEITEAIEKAKIAYNAETDNICKQFGYKDRNDSSLRYDCNYETLIKEKIGEISVDYIFQLQLFIDEHSPYWNCSILHTKPLQFDYRVIDAKFNKKVSIKI